MPGRQNPAGEVVPLLGHARAKKGLETPRHWQQNRVLAKEDSVAANYGPGKEIRVQGVQWIFGGASAHVAWYKGLFPDRPPAARAGRSVARW
jgi:hypothetical protein